MKVLDLFAGTGSSTQAFEDHEHHVKRLEIEPRFKAEYEVDIRQFAKNPQWFLGSWKPDVVWASPPCQAFSLGGSGTGAERWKQATKETVFGPRIPRRRIRTDGTTDYTSLHGCAYVLATLHIIRVLKPQFWWMENPQGGLKTMGFMQPLGEPVTVTYCQYGDTRMKPTNLWGVHPVEWNPRARCYNGETCHEAAPRGSPTGTQGLANDEERSRVPYELGLEICLAVEKVFENSSPSSPSFSFPFVPEE